jgi:hypothetical protein
LKHLPTFPIYAKPTFLLHFEILNLFVYPLLTSQITAWQIAHKGQISLTVTSIETYVL